MFSIAPRALFRFVQLKGQTKHACILSSWHVTAIRPPMAAFGAFSRSSADPAAFRRPALIAFHFKHRFVHFPQQTVLITALINFCPNTRKWQLLKLTWIALTAAFLGLNNAVVSFSGQIILHHYSKPKVSADFCLYVPEETQLRSSISA